MSFLFGAGAVSPVQAISDTFRWKLFYANCIQNVVSLGGSNTYIQPALNSRKSRDSSRALGNFEPEERIFAEQPERGERSKKRTV